jgi:hypothetical protein
MIESRNMIKDIWKIKSMCIKSEKNVRGYKKG